MKTNRTINKKDFRSFYFFEKSLSLMESQEDYDPSDLEDLVGCDAYPSDAFNLSNSHKVD